MNGSPGIRHSLICLGCDYCGGILQILAFVVLFLAGLFLFSVLLFLVTVVLIIRENRNRHLAGSTFKWFPIGVFALSLFCLVRLEHFLEYGVRSKTVQYCVIGATAAILTIIFSYLVPKIPRRSFLIGGVLNLILWGIAIKAVV